MIDVCKLRAAWVAKGKTQEEVATALGISNKTMGERMKKAVFGSDEIDKLVTILDIRQPAEIFFLSW